MDINKAKALLEEIQNEVNQANYERAYEMLSDAISNVYQALPLEGILVESQILCHMGQYRKALIVHQDFRRKFRRKPEMYARLREQELQFIEICNQHPEPDQVAKVIKWLDSRDPHDVIGALNEIEAHLPSMDRMRLHIEAALLRKYDDHNMIYYFAPLLFDVWPNQTIRYYFYGKIKKVVLNEKRLTKRDYLNYRNINDHLYELTLDVELVFKAEALVSAFVKTIFPSIIKSNERLPLAHIFLYFARLASKNHNKKMAEKLLYHEVNQILVATLMRKYYLHRLIS